MAAAEHPIDVVLARAHHDQHLVPSGVCSDETFLRRVSLDLVGRIPTTSEQQQFLPNPNRREVVDTLLASDEFPRFWSELWTAALNGYGQGFQADRDGLRVWLENAFRQNMPFDRIAAKLIAAEGESAFAGHVNFLLRHPEEPVVAVSRLFLGVRLDCARCHDHPFDRWTSDDFHQMQRFFELTDRVEVAEGNLALRNLSQRVEPDERPRFLTGARPRTSRWRDELALFVTHSKPFARNWANRVWYYLMGRGVVHPVDDFNRENRPTVPPLLTLLTKQAIAEEFDTRKMIRFICSSQAYQRSSTGETSEPLSVDYFARRVLKPMTPEQFLNSVEVAVGRETSPDERREWIEQMVGGDLDNPFHVAWRYDETVQGFMSRLAEAVPVPSPNTEQLYRRILSRAPTAQERAMCRGRSARDVTFALLHSNEFFFNH